MDPDSGLCEIDVTLRRLTGMQDLPQTFGTDLFIGRIAAEDRDQVESAISKAIADDSIYEAEFQFAKPNGDVIWLLGRGRPVKIADGRTILIGVNVDVTADRTARDRAEIIAGEMAHRLKNVFALIQSMFNVAARNAQSKDDLVDAFQGRLAALATVNAMMFSNAARRVDLRDLATTLLQSVIDSERVSVDLPERYALNGAAAQTLILALHELLTNAVKHGALSQAGGTVALQISVDDNDFVLSWTETCPMPIHPPQGRGGFGMRVLGSMTRATFTGDPIFDWRPEGLAFQCTWPETDFRHVPDAAYAEQVVASAVATADMAQGQS
ncbi:MAG: HWE histidine kinase domain-containing protein [Pseudomonadota bacterium]